MSSNSTIVPLRQPDEIDDPLTAVLRSGARRLLAQAIEAEAEAFLAHFADRKLADGRDRVVRHGYGPERTIQTGIGPVEVRRVKRAARPRRRQSGRASLLHLDDPATLGAADAQPGCAPAGTLSAWRLDR